eukprot:scaffold12022_cov143-Skeletonema_marinoi.AAC.3
MAAEEEYYIYTGGVVPRHVTRVRIDKSISVIPAQAFRGRPITELDCHIGVKKVEEFAFDDCPSLRLVVMPGVKEVKRRAFWKCGALTDVECGKLEIIEGFAFHSCFSLRSIDMPSIKTVEELAFGYCRELTSVKFGRELESIRDRAFYGCRSLERIILPLKDRSNIITDDNAFQGCQNLKYVGLVEGAILHETMAALHMEGWKNDMNEEIASINQILPNAPAGDIYPYVDVGAGRKAQAIKTWIRSVLHKMVQYKAQHQHYLNEAATTLQLALPNDIVCKNVLPFLELPSYTFELED